MLINIFALAELATDAYNPNDEFCPLLKRQMIDKHTANMRHTQLSSDVSNDIRKLYEQLRRAFTPKQLVSSCKSMNAKYNYVRTERLWRK